MQVLGSGRHMQHSLHEPQININRNVDMPIAMMAVNVTENEINLEDADFCYGFQRLRKWFQIQEHVCNLTAGLFSCVLYHRLNLRSM